MAWRAGYPLYVIFLSLTLLIFCGDDEDNSPQTDETDSANTPVSASSPSSPSSPSPSSPGAQDTADTPRYKFNKKDNIVTAGLHFNFELAWLGKPYLLSLDNCDPDTLLLQGRWPDSREASAYIRGVQMVNRSSQSRHRQRQRQP